MSRWVVSKRGGSWYVRWTGRGGDAIHDDQSFLTRKRAVAIRDALNATEPHEMRALYAVWREVRSSELRGVPPTEGHPK